MPPKVYPVPGLEANPDHVQEGTTALYKAFEELARVKQYSIIDVFMIGHSFHKVVMLNVMARWQADGVPPETTYHLADMTWRNAIRQLTKLASRPREKSPQVAAVQLPAAKKEP